VVHESRRGEAIGILTMGYTVGMSLGPLVGSFMVDHYSYNAMFYTSSAFALGSVVILYNIKETLPSPKKFRFSILRLKPNELFVKSSIKPAIILLLLSFASGCTLTLAPDLSDNVGLHNKGLFFAIYTATSLVIRVLAGKSSDKYGRVPVLIVSSFTLVVAMLILAFAHSEWMLVTGSAIFGLSWGMNGPTITAWTVDLALPAMRGRAVASMYIALEAGIGIGAYICAEMYNNRASNFVYAFITPAFLAAVAMVLLLVWQKKKTTAVLVMDSVVVEEELM
jgi:MFS family permease